MKRIVFTVSNDLSFDQRMIKICSSLSGSEFEVSILGFEKAGSAKLSNQPYQQKRMKLIFQRGKLFYLEICIRLFFKLLFTKTDIISAVDMDTLLPAYLVSKMRNKKLVFDAHEFYSETSGLVGRKFEKTIWAKLEEFLIPKLIYGYTVNESLSKLFFEKFKTTFSVIMNVPVLEEYKSFSKNREHFYLYQGVLNRGRGLEELLEVFSINDLELRIAGEGPLKKELQIKIDKKGIGERVKLLGFISPKELKQLSQNAFAGFNLIEGSGKSYYYSLANKFFDYMHAEIPQIGMNFPEYKKINDKYEISILIDSFSEIESAINRLEDQEGYRDILIANAAKAKFEYEWKNEEAKLLSFYRDLS